MTEMSGKALAKLLEQHGWQLKRITGSHHISTRPGSTVRLSVPIHGSKPLKEGLLRFLLKQAGLSHLVP
jgi:predicted RNA binding protein YcfA (HicA-like mRNA interferase family)